MVSATLPVFCPTSGRMKPTVVGLMRPSRNFPVGSYVGRRLVPRSRSMLGVVGVAGLALTVGAVLAAAAMAVGASDGATFVPAPLQRGKSLGAAASPAPAAAAAAVAEAQPPQGLAASRRGGLRGRGRSASAAGGDKADRAATDVIDPPSSMEEEFREWSSRFSPWAEKPPPKKEGEPIEDVRTQLGVFLSVVAVAAGLLLAANSALNTKDFKNASGKTFQEQAFEQWYSRASEAAKKANRVAAKAKATLDEGVSAKPSSGPTLVNASVVERIREIGKTLDLCQQDIYDEFWQGLETYSNFFRGYISLFAYYNDTAYPPTSTDGAVKLYRESLTFEVGQYSRGVAGFEAAVKARSIREAERTFAEMSLAYDRYLKAGSLYSGYDPVTSTTVFYDQIPESMLVYTPITLEQARIRDEVLVIQGPDKGKVGRVIWLGRNPVDAAKDPGQVATATVKLDSNPFLGYVREVKAYPYSWIAVTRTSQQNFFVDLVLASLAAAFSCSLTYPLDSLKSRIQSGLPLLPEDGPLGLFKGLPFNLGREVPNQGLYMACFNLLTRQFCLLPFVDANNPNLKLLVMVPAGILGFVSGSFLRAPFEVLNRQMQIGAAATEEEAIQQTFVQPPPSQVFNTLQKAWILTVFKGVPFGALQCTFYELFKDRLELIQYGCPLQLQPFVWGALAGCLTGVITNPPDVILGKVIEAKPDKEGGDQDIFGELIKATVAIQQEEGVGGYFRGAGARALYFAPEACLWFAAYETLRQLSEFVAEI